MKAVYVRSSVRLPFGLIDAAVVRAMRRLGVEVRTVSPGPRLERDLRQAMRSFRPDFLLAMLGCRLSSDHLALLRSLSVPKAIWYTDDPYAIDESVRTCRSFDWVFTNDRLSVPVYRRKGCSRVEHLPLAAPVPEFSPGRVSPDYRSQILILGTAFTNRLTLTDRLAPLLSRYRTRIIGPGWDRLRRKDLLGPFIRSRWVSHREARRYYNGADIVLNIHRSHDDDYLDWNRSGIRASTPNNRVFEIAACSAFQLVTHRGDLPSLYAVPEEVVSYRSVEELRERIPHYLKRDDDRKAAAHRAYERTMKEHLYEHRVERIIRRIFPGKPVRRDFHPFTVPR